MLGEIIHGYRVDRALSADKGGFGDVYFATHVESGADAVVKVLKPEMSAQRDIVARFFNEARAAASVHHPGIVQIHNMGYHRDRAYLLMERLRGDDLETRLAHGPLPVERAVLFVRQAAGAIGAAHDRGIVHRDLKPANLFAVPDPDVVGGERVKVLDFGIAKLTDGAGGSKTQGIFGTPSYMSPEQCASAAGVDGRSDLYSLGCIFYELVCGRPPFGHGGLELIASHLRDTPPPPRAIAPWVPPAIEQVILRLLEKQPGDRFPSCAALITVLDEAARVSGLPAVSASGLPAASASQQPAISGALPTHDARSGQPPVSGFSSAYDPRHGHAGSPSTLGGAASARTAPPGARGRGIWLGLAAVLVVGVAGAAIAVVSRTNAPAPQPAGSGDPGVVAVAPVDAGVVAVARIDAAALPTQIDAALQVTSGEQEHGEPPAKQLHSKVAVDSRIKSPPPERRVATTVAQTGKQGDKSSSTTPGDPQRANPPAASTPATSPTPAVSPNAAPPPTQTPAEQAAWHNERGKEAIYADRYAEAEAHFLHAYALDPQGKYLLNLSVSEVQAGHCNAAWDHVVVLRKRWPDTKPDGVKKLIPKIEACRSK